MDFLQAVLDQPRTLNASRTSLTEAMDGWDPAPWRTGTLGVVGMGASTHAAHALVHVLAGGGRRVLNISATDLLDDAREPADAYLVVSESGRSRETIEAARRLRGPRLGLTNNPLAPLATVVDHVLPLGGFEDSPVYTIGYTATLQAFGILAPALCGGGPVAPTDWAQVADRAAAVLQDCDEFVADAVEAVAPARFVDVVGRRGQLASAAETALLLREAVRVPTAVYDTLQYLHGPMEPLQEEMACIVFGSDDREVELARFVASTGATAILITTADVPAAERLLVHQTPAAGPFANELLEMLPVQLLTHRLAGAAGLPIEGFRYHQDDTKVPV